MTDRTKTTTTSWYADNHLEEVDDAWTMDDPDAYRRAMPWRPQSVVLAEAERRETPRPERVRTVQVEEVALEELEAEEELLAADEVAEELSDELVTEVEGLMAADLFSDELVDVHELEEELTDEEVVDLASALAAEIRDAIAGDLDEGALSPLDEPTLVEVTELHSMDLHPLDEPTLPTESLVLVPGYSVQCEPAANAVESAVLDRATPARIARRLWQRDIDRLAC